LWVCGTLVAPVRVGELHEVEIAGGVGPGLRGACASAGARFQEPRGEHHPTHSGDLEELATSRLCHVHLAGAAVARSPSGRSGRGPHSRGNTFGTAAVRLVLPCAEPGRG